MWCAAYIRATREFDLAVAAQPLAEFDKLLAADPTVVILDIRDPSFIDARGMRVLIDLRTSCEEQGRRFVLVRGQRKVHRMLVLCNLVQAFEFVDSAAEAGELTGWLTDCLPRRTRSSARAVLWPSRTPHAWPGAPIDDGANRATRGRRTPTESQPIARWQGPPRPNRPLSSSSRDRPHAAPQGSDEHLPRS